MDLSLKLSNVPKDKKSDFLRKKLRELRLLYKVDMLTDRHKNIVSLSSATLRLARNFFKCQTAALLFTDKEARHRQFYLALGLETDASGNDINLHLKELMHKTVGTGDSADIVNRDSEASAELTDYILASFSVSDRLCGALMIGNREKPWDEEDLHYLRSIISQVDNGLEHAFLNQKYQRSRKLIAREARKLSFVYEISLSLGKDEDFSSLCCRILESAMQLVDVNRCSFMRYDADTDELRTEFAIGIPFVKSQLTLKLGQGLAGAALKEGRAILSSRGSSDLRFIPFNKGPEDFPSIVNLACLPLIVEGQPMGVLNFSSTDPSYSVTPDELAALEVVTHLIALAWQKQRLYQVSIKDELTGMYSFRFFKQRLQDEMNRANRYESLLSIVMFDIDHFKMFNDSYGHLAGNFVLREFAAILDDSIRTGIDIAARFGGEEFVLILPGTPESGAVLVAERIRTLVENRSMEYDGQSLKVNVSGGIRQFLPGMSLDDFIQNADQALYVAKESGRNQTKGFSTLPDTIPLPS
ncbi:MAG: diguanylate cyclase [Candidatus Riflebacteria bacterium]|nr:diguanylate cyclase [Candidatus Riflebacteria bacterium]